MTTYLLWKAHDMNPEQWLLITLGLLFIKHWYVDFVIQTDAEVKHKGIYGHLTGIQHSFKHTVASILVFFLAGLEPQWVVFFALLDGVLHYHIDWAKMNYGNRDITTPQFWNHLGLDQLAHSICYLFIVYYAGLT
jgi:hypothetical protein